MKDTTQLTPLVYKQTLYSNKYILGGFHMCTHTASAFRTRHPRTDIE